MSPLTILYTAGPPSYISVAKPGEITGHTPSVDEDLMAVASMHLLLALPSGGTADRGCASGFRLPIAGKAPELKDKRQTAHAAPSQAHIRYSEALALIIDVRDQLHRVAGLTNSTL